MVFWAVVRCWRFVFGQGGEQLRMRFFGIGLLCLCAVAIVVVVSQAGFAWVVGWQRAKGARRWITWQAAVALVVMLP